MSRQTIGSRRSLIHHHYFLLLFITLITVVSSFPLTPTTTTNTDISTNPTTIVTSRKGMTIGGSSRRIGLLAAKKTTSTKLFSSMEAAAVATREPKIAIIGAGASGLAVARVFSRNGFTPIVFEKKKFVGGVWKHDKNSNDNDNSNTDASPMYNGLRTNLPKELMAYRELPFQQKQQSSTTATTTLPSYVSHKDVVEYLNDYQNEYQLQQYISFSSKVTKLQLVPNSKSIVSPPFDNNDKDHNNKEEIWPTFQIEWETETKEENVAHQKKKDIFDIVCICNGHYAKPSMPPMDTNIDNDSSVGIKGVHHFTGNIIHSIKYNDPKIYKDKTVLCIGANASGNDIAREISQHAQKVYLSDSNFPLPKEDDYENDNKNSNHQMLDNVVWTSRTMEIQSNGSVLFNGGYSTEEQIDTIIYCSGYDYDFPFIIGSDAAAAAAADSIDKNNDDDNQLLQFVSGERRVSPLYEQLWHAKYPTLSLLGIPHSVVPFPVFELQAEAIYAQTILRSQNKNNQCTDPTNTKQEEKEQESALSLLPSLQKRMEESKKFDNAGGYAPNGRVPKDTHFLGSGQWDYCRKLAKWAGIYDTSMEHYIATNQAIYEHAGKERKSLFKGGPDTYRETCYTRDDKSKDFTSYTTATNSDTPITSTN